MKKLIYVVLAGVMCLAVAESADAAKQMKGMWGPGYFRPEAPVGIRFWATDMVGIDVGIGLSSREVGAGDDAETKLAFRLDGGVPVVAAGTDNTLFFVRPGIFFASTPISPDDSMTDLGISASLGVEHFFSNRFSVQVAHGLVFSSHDPGIEGADSTTEFETEAFGISNIGFHYYLFPAE